MPEERKLVTVLFCDVVGSTEIGESHDPEVVRAALARMFAVQREVLEAHGGTVEKFIGDAVMAVFGVPAAHDDDADRAVRAAFALRERIQALNSPGRPTLVVRVGISSGEAVTGAGPGDQFLVTGPVVNTAARIQSAAAPGEILVGALARRLTGDVVRYGGTRTVDAKGIGRIEAWPAEELVTAVPEQRRGIPGLRAPLVGRDRELRLLREAYDLVREQGEPYLVTVFGPPGAGKSRLTSEFVASLAADRVRIGRCLPYGEGITFYPVQQIIRADAGIAPHDDREAALRKVRATTMAAFPDASDEAEDVVRSVAVLAALGDPGDLIPALEGAALAEQLRWGLRRYLERRAGASPLVLIFEDVHWAEPGLLDLVEHVGESARGPLFVLCLARPDFRELRPAWASGAANALSITLSPLSSEDTRELIRLLLAVDALPESLRVEVVARSEGNPLYVEEFLRSLIETSAIAQRDGRWIATQELASAVLPPSLQALITARLDRVGPDVKLLLQRASLPGRLFSTAALAALSEGVMPADEQLRDAVRRDLIVEADERTIGAGRVYRFKHVLIRDVAYGTVPKAERSRLHDRYSRWLEATFADRSDEIIEIIAQHAAQAYVLARELADPGAVATGRRALALLLAAARRAREREEVRAALSLYERAATIAEELDGSVTERAHAMGHLVLLRRLLGQDRPPEDLDQGIALARAAGELGILSLLLGVRAAVLHQQGHRDRALVASEEAIAVARAGGDRDTLSRVLQSHAHLLVLLGDVTAGRALLREAVAEATGTINNVHGPALYWLARFAVVAGDFTEAERYFQESMATIPATNSKFYRALQAWANATHAWDLGDSAGAIAVGEAALEPFRELDIGSYCFSLCRVLGESYLDLDDSRRAIERFAEGAETVERRGLHGLIPEFKARSARACVRLGDLAGARRHLDGARSVPASDHGSVHIIQIAEGELAEAEGDARRADLHFHAAIRALEGTPFASRLATAREAYGAFLVRSGPLAEGRHQLDAARDFYADPLAFRHRERVESLLASAGAIG